MHETDSTDGARRRKGNLSLGPALRRGELYTRQQLLRRLRCNGAMLTLLVRRGELVPIRPGSKAMFFEADDVIAAMKRVSSMPRPKKRRPK